MTMVQTGIRLKAAKASALVLFLNLGLSLLTTAATPLTFLEQLDNRLHLQTRNGWLKADVSGLLDFETYSIDQLPPGLIFENDDIFFNPRLSLFLDATLGERFYLLVQARADRGFDPGSRPNGDIRADEYFLRYTPLDEPVINIQAGKFATVFGNWVPRHDSWSNPFITAPLPYENMTTLGDQAALPGRTPLLARKGVVVNKRTWIPVIWGPSYASGASVFGAIERFDYAFEFKNAALSSRPYAWDAYNHSFEHPTYTGRVGYRPTAAWNVGASASYGAYMVPAAERSPAFPTGRTLDDFPQLTIGSDISYAWRHWQVWAEAIATRFETPEVGDAEAIMYYLELKRKLGARWFVAGRWNQQFFDEVINAAGAPEPWDNDIWRIDAAIGYRHNRHLQAKIQYSYAHERAARFQQGEQLLAAQLTLKF